MPWIKTISFPDSSGKLRQVYDRLKGKGGYLDNIITIHALRPHSLEGHMKLYKNVLHHSGNKVPKQVLEILGVYVSYLNSCSYCFEHHFAGLARLVNDEDRSNAMKEAIQQNNLEANFSTSILSVLKYAKALTLTPQNVDESFIVNIRKNGYSDGEILEVNQVISYFAYANRTINGLGVTTEGDILGLSPSDSDDENNWTHQ